MLPYERWEIDLVYICNIFPFVECDLVILQNKEYKYLLNIIDTFTKYAFIKPLKTKSAKEIADSFLEIFELKCKKYVKNSKNEIDEIIIIPDIIKSDAGVEFNNKNVKELFNRYNIKFEISEGYHHLQIIERFNKTIKDKIFNYIKSRN